MGDNAMKSTLRALSLGASVLATTMVVAPSAEARILIDALGGEVKLEGYLSSEARANVGNGEAYLNQWIQRFELNAEVNYEDVGVFDTLSFVSVIRPEFDAAYYYGDSIGHGTARNAGGTSYMGDTFTYDNAPREFGGFDIYQNVRFGGVNFGGGANNAIGDVNRATGNWSANAGRPLNMTGGLSKVVTNGFQNPSWLTNNFETILNRAPGQGKYSPNNTELGGFSGAAVTSQMELNCIRCYDLDDDPLDVAMNNTGSSGRLYPFRELYVDATAGDWWFRVGKQQIVWGKTDFFRMQDLVNPVDFGQHFFFDSFEDIRIPQWIASAQWKFGNVGPTTDNAIQFLWNFDEFQRIGLGNPSQGWAHPFSKDISVFAMYNTFFAVEPCISSAVELERSQKAASLGLPGGAFINDNVCGSRGPQDMRSPAGFGSPAGLRIDDRPDWELGNTEGGVRWEFRLGELHIAASYYYGWNDVPVFQYENINVMNTGLAGFQPLGANTAANLALGQRDCTVSDLTGGIISGHPFAGFGGALDPNSVCPQASLGFPIQVMNPGAGIGAIAANGSTDVAVDSLTGEVSTISDFAQRAITQKDATLFYRASTNALTGGHVKMSYKQSHTPGLSFDYFEPWSGVVFRVESSWTFDELVNNTRKADWVDKSDIMKWSIGLDRPTFIPWLNKDRTFFLSMQVFDTWMMDHEGDKHSGFLQDEHNFITTFFYIGNYMRDKLKPVGFVVWEESSNSYVFGQSVEWFIDNHWSVKGGLHMLWGGNENFRHDAGPYHSFALPSSGGPMGFGGNYPFHQLPLGVARQGIGALSNNDEVFFQLKYQF